MSSLESQLVNAIREEVFRRWPKAWVLKAHGNTFQASGTPDLIVCVGGRFVALEVKHPYAGETEEDTRGRATKAQRITLRKIAVAGGWAAVVCSVDQAVAIIERALTRDDRKEQDDDRTQDEE